MNEKSQGYQDGYEDAKKDMKKKLKKMIKALKRQEKIAWKERRHDDASGHFYTAATIRSIMHGIPYLGVRQDVQ